MKTSKAFTLIELLIVIGIIAVIATAIIIAVNPGQRLAEARDVTREGHLKALETALYVYFIDNGDFPETVNLNLLEICNTNLVEDCGSLINFSGLDMPIPVDPLGGIHENGTGYEVAIIQGKVVLNAPLSEQKVISTNIDVNIDIVNYSSTATSTAYYWRGYKFKVSREIVVTHLIGGMHTNNSYIIGIYTSNGNMPESLLAKVDSSVVTTECVKAYKIPSVTLVPDQEYIIAQGATLNAPRHCARGAINVVNLINETFLDEWIPVNGNSLRWGAASNENYILGKNPNNTNDANRPHLGFKGVY